MRGARCVLAQREAGQRQGCDLVATAARRRIDSRFPLGAASGYRDECRTAHWFASLTDARFLIARWRQDFNDARPHSSLGSLTPTEKARQLLAQTPQDAPPTRLSA